MNGEFEELINSTSTTSDTIKVYSLIKPFCNKKLEIQKFSEYHNYKNSFQFCIEDPYKHVTLNEDSYLSYWRSERKNNYKKGTVETLGPVFELRENYIWWYR